MAYGFGPYLLDVQERSLQCGSQRVKLEPKVFDVLCYLVQNPNKLVKKQELIDSVWSGSAIGDNSLTRSIHQIRAALGDEVDCPTYLETVRGTGYRFIAPVRNSPPDQVAAHAPPRRKANLAAISIVLLAVATFWIAEYFELADDDEAPRIAVLPLDNFSGDPAQEYFVNGIHEALIGELSRIEALDVISRSSVLHYSPGEVALQQIADQLDIDYVIEGAIAREGSGLTVSLPLIQPERERNVWSGRFHRDVADVFEITTEIARSIAAEVSVQLSESEKLLLIGAEPVDERAYDRFLRARSLHQLNPPESGEEALDLYREAISIDPEFALAYVGMADAIGSAIVFGLRSPVEYIPVVRDLTDTALRLDSTLAAAHRLDAAVQFYGSWDMTAAEASARRALGLDPSFADAYKLIAEIYAVNDQPDAAWEAIQRGRSLDPIPPVSRFKPVLILYLTGNFARARDLVIEELASQPDFWQGHWLQCISSSALQLHEEAIAACQAAASTSHRTPMALGALGFVLARAGYSDDASSVAQELYAIRESRYVSASYLAMTLAALGQEDLALDELTRAYEEGDINLIYIEAAEYWEPLRDNARFQELVDRVQAASS